MIVTMYFRVRRCATSVTNSAMPIETGTAMIMPISDVTSVPYSITKVPKTSSFGAQRVPVMNPTTPSSWMAGRARSVVVTRIRPSTMRTVSPAKVTRPRKPRSAPRARESPPRSRSSGDGGVAVAVKMLTPVSVAERPKTPPARIAPLGSSDDGS